MNELLLKDFMVDEVRIALSQMSPLKVSDLMDFQRAFIKKIRQA
jgi:hypothetical protein